MAAVAQATFLGALGMLAWIYVGLPLALVARGRLFPRPVRDDGPPVGVSVILAAHDEADVIGSRIQNLLDQDYPAHLLHVVVACDGGDDGTFAHARLHASCSVDVLNLPRVGKAAAMNAAITAARHDVVAFTDANSVWSTGALRALVAPFADPTVGGVAGDQIYVGEDATDAVAAGELTYWNLDRELKRAQSRAGSVTSATGAIYAMRRELIEAVPGNVTDDFFLSTAAVMAGQRLVFAPAATAYETLAPTQQAEFARKVRIMTRGLQAVRLRASLLNPFRHGFYAVQLLTHKVLRRLAFVPLLLLLLAALIGAPDVTWLRVAAVLQLLFYAMAVVGLLLRGRSRGRLSRLLRLPAFVLLTYAAAAIAVTRAATGRHVEKWSHDRQAFNPLIDPTDGGS